MTATCMRAVVLAALAGGAGVVALVLTSDHQDAKPVWAIFGPAVGWSFIGTGLYAWRRRPESRTGALMMLLGFAWFFSTLESANSPLIYTLALAAGGLWGGVFLHLGMSFPSGRLAPGLDRALVIAGYLIFTFAFAPALLFAGQEELGCDDCPTNLLLVRRDEDLANVAFVFRGLALRRLLRDRARPVGTALAEHRPARAAPAHAGLCVRPAHLPPRGGGQGRCGRRRLVGRLHILRAAAVRLSGRSVAQPRLPSRRRVA